MKKTYKDIFIFLTFLALGCWGCYEDKGNYDYIQLPPIVVDTTGMHIDEEKVAYQFEVLNLAPDIQYSGDKANLKYEWRLYLQNSQKPEGQQYYDTVPVISTEPAFNKVIYDVPGDYYITLTVYDQKYDVKTYWTCKVKVESVLSSGLCVLDEKEGVGDIHLIKDVLFQPSLTEEQQKTTFNIYSNINSSEELRDVRFLGFRQKFGWGEKPVFYVFAKDKGLSLLKDSYQANATDYSDLFTFSIGMTYNPQAYGVLKHADVLINNGRIYEIVYGGMSVDPTTFSEITGDYTAAPFVARVNSNNDGVFFDTQHHRFMYLPWINFYFVSSEFINVSATEVFDVNRIEKELLWLEAGWDYKTFAVFRDPTTSRYSLYQANFTGDFVNNIAPAIAEAVYDMNECPGVSANSLFTFGNLGNVCYYSAGDKLYLYRYTEVANRAEEVKNLIGSGEEITFLKIFKHDKHAQNGKVLLIGTYKEGQGKVYRVGFNEITGTVDVSAKKVYGEEGGFGRIKDIQFKD